jgi:hypothetical protein
VLYYTALDFTAQVWQIGMATSPLTPVSVGERPETVPGGYSLAQSYPNPFNPMVTVEFSLPREEFVTIIVFDALGREVVTLAHELWGPGRHRVVWEAANAASGKYWYRMQAGAFTDTKSMVLLH